MGAESFNTNPPAPTQLEAAEAAYWRMQITDLNAGGYEDVVQAVLCNFDGSNPGTTKHYVKLVLGGRRVSDLLFVSRPRGGTDVAFGQSKVMYQELPGAGMSVGQFQYMVYQMVAQNQAGWDFFRAHPLITG